MSFDDLFADEDLADDEPGTGAMLDAVDKAMGEAIEEEPEPEFASVYEFVEDHLSLLYARKWEHAGKTRLWCARWFEHAEAVSRLEAVWRAYESLRLDPTLGMSVWWRDHLDPHMNALTNPEGPFEGCTTHEHKPRTTSMPCERLDDDPVRSAMSVDGTLALTQ